MQHRRQTFRRAERLLSLAALLAAVNSAASFASAATKTWDLDAAGDANGVVDNGSGTWDTSATANWTTNGGTSNTLWSDNDDAVFGGNPGVGAAGTITLSGTVNANSITFNPAASGNFALTGGTQLNLTGSSGLIVVNADASIASIIGGSNGLTKSGAGTLTLAGNDSVSGAVTANNGTLTLSGSAGAVASATSYVINAGGTLKLDNSGSTNGNRIASAPITMNGGTLNFIGAAGLTESTGNFTSAVGANTLALSGAATTTLAFGSFSRTGGSTVNFTAANTSDRATFTGLTSNAFINAGTFVDGSNYAWYDTGGFVRALAYGTDANTTSGTTLATATVSNKHVRLTASASTPGSETILTLNLSGATVGVSMGNNDVLTLTNGGIIKSGGGSSAISGGNPNTKLATASEWIINTVAANDQLTISEPLSGGTILTKTGLGTLVLNAGASYSGNTFIDQGTLRLGGANQIPDASTVTILPSATFDMNGVSDTVGGLTLYGGTISSTGTPTLTLNGNAAGVTYAGTSSGATISVSTLALATGANATHTFTVADGDAAVDLNITSIIANGANVQGIDKQGAGTLRLGSSNSYTGVTNVTAGTLQLDGSLNSASTVNVATAGTLSGSGTVNGNATLTGNGNINFSSGAVIAGTLGVTSGGFWNGLGSVTGTSTVNSGTFTVNGTLAGAGGLSLANGANLAGTGAVNKTLTLGGNNTLSSAGTLTIGSAVAWNSAGNSISSGTISTQGDTISNSLAINGTLGGTGIAAITTSGTVTGTGTINKNASVAGNGTINFGSGGSITGALAVTGGNWSGQGSVAGNTTVSSGSFTVNGTMSGAGNVDVNSTAKLAGTGTINKTVNVNSGGTISPAGDGSNATIGAIATNDHNWGSNATYVWEIKDASGPAGSGYDTVNVNGNLTVNATNAVGGQMIIKVISYGPLANWNNKAVYTWTIATANNINNFSADKFVLDTTGFTDDNPSDIGSHFEVDATENQIRVVYIPEPASAVTLGGLAIALLGRRSRRGK